MTASTDVDAVRALFGAFASGDLAALTDLMHPGATWHHHNDDRTPFEPRGLKHRPGGAIRCRAPCADGGGRVGERELQQGTFPDDGGAQLVGRAANPSTRP